ncbi:MAG: V-type ATP synthase subunit D, partial [Lentisphaerae bacterium GWF2_44_16]
MAKIKLTKTELKKQRDALKQFLRFLPTLQLKKQQLQMEMRKCQDLLRQNEEKERLLREKLSSWISLFGGGESVTKISKLLTVSGVKRERRNIAGVDIPVFKSVDFNIVEYNLFSEEIWIDDAVKAVMKVIELKIEHKIIEEQYRLIENELRVTTQRVNLFEKVKIPGCKENIRVIQIYLGDMSTA